MPKLPADPKLDRCADERCHHSRAVHVGGKGSCGAVVILRRGTFCWCRTFVEEKKPSKAKRL